MTHQTTLFRFISQPCFFGTPQFRIASHWSNGVLKYLWKQDPVNTILYLIGEFIIFLASKWKTLSARITFEHLAASIAKVDRRALFDFIAWSLRDAWRIRNSLPHFRLQSDSQRRYTDTDSGLSSLYCLRRLKNTYYCNIPYNHTIL